MKIHRTPEQLKFDLDVYAETGNWDGAISDILDYYNRFGYDEYLSNYLNSNLNNFLGSRKRKRKLRGVK